MRLTLIILLILGCFQIAFSQHNFVIENNRTGKTRTYKLEDKVVFKTLGSNLVHTGYLDSVGATSFFVSGAEIPFSDLSFIVVERKWRKHLIPIATIGFVAGFALNKFGLLWTIAGVGGNPNYLKTGPLYQYLGKHLTMLALVPIYVTETRLAIPTRWHVVLPTD